MQWKKGIVLQAGFGEACIGYVRLADKRCCARLREPRNEDPPEIRNRYIRGKMSITFQGLV